MKTKQKPFVGLTVCLYTAVLQGGILAAHYIANTYLNLILKTNKLRLSAYKAPLIYGYAVLSKIGWALALG